MAKQDKNLARVIAPLLRGLRAAGVRRGGRAGDRGRGRLLGNSRGVVALEFAIISVPFFMLTLGVMEISYDLFTQAALDLSLSTAVRALQVGKAQNLWQNSTTGASNQAFIQNYLCPAMGLMLECHSNVFVKVQTFAAGKPGANGVTDYSNIAKGIVPSSGNSFDDSSFTASSSFCNVQKKQFILVSAVYLGPSFVGGLLPNVFSLQYQGNTVHATLSTLGVATEQFSPGNSTTNPPAGTTTLAPC